MQFTVRYLDPTAGAAVQTAHTEAASESELREQLTSMGCIVVGVQAGAQPAMRRLATGSLASSNFEVAWWCRELRTLLVAGMTVVEALETLNAQSVTGQRAAVQAKLLKALREGLPLSKAMQGSGAFPEVLVASVMASERTSTLVDALDNYLHHDEMLVRLRKQAVSAAIYPSVVIALGLMIILFLLIYVIPRFSRIYEDVQGPVSWPTQVLLGISRGLQVHGFWVVLGFMLFVGAVFDAWRRGRLRQWLEQVIGRIQPLQRQLNHFRLTKLYQSLALMFKGGYTLDEALALSEGLGLGASLMNGIREARAKLARGQAVSTSFAQAGLTDTVTERLLAVGERTGGFHAVLQTIAERHAEAFGTFIERATRIIEPLLLMLVAVMVGGIVVMMYMPIFDLASGIR